MKKLKVIENFTLKDYDKLKEVIRNDRTMIGKLFIDDIIICDNDMADYLLGKNPLHRAVVKLIEEIPENGWAVTKENDNAIHVRPVVDNEIIDTPIEKIIKPKTDKKKISKKK